MNPTAPFDPSVMQSAIQKDVGQREPELQAAISRAFRELDDVEQRVAALVERLEPVLSFEYLNSLPPPQPGLEQVDPALPLSTRAGHVEEIARRLSALAGKLAVLRAAVEA